MSFWFAHWRVHIAWVRYDTWQEWYLHPVGIHSIMGDYFLRLGPVLVSTCHE